MPKGACPDRSSDGAPCETPTLLYVSLFNIVFQTCLLAFSQLFLDPICLFVPILGVSPTKGPQDQLWTPPGMITAIWFPCGCSTLPIHCPHYVRRGLIRPKWGGTSILLVKTVKRWENAKFQHFPPTVYDWGISWASSGKDQENPGANPPRQLLGLLGQQIRSWTLEEVFQELFSTLHGIEVNP